VFTGQQRQLQESAIAVGPLLADFPVAVLEISPQSCDA